jgi:hypothetical protein
MIITKSDVNHSSTTNYFHAAAQTFCCPVELSANSTHEVLAGTSRVSPLLRETSNRKVPRQPWFKWDLRTSILSSME